MQRPFAVPGVKLEARVRVLRGLPLSYPSREHHVGRIACAKLGRTGAHAAAAFVPRLFLRSTLSPFHSHPLPLPTLRRYCPVHPYARTSASDEKEGKRIKTKQKEVSARGFSRCRRRRRSGYSRVVLLLQIIELLLDPVARLKDRELDRLAGLRRNLWAKHENIFR